MPNNMTDRFILKIVTDFAAAHTLRDYPGACNRMHGHNWKVEVEVIGSELDDTGMVVDFKKIKRATNEIADRLDHYYINDIEPFTEINPTAENIAKYFYQELSLVLDANSTSVKQVTLWETERACATYSRANT